MKLPGARILAVAGASALALGVLAGVTPPASAHSQPALSPGLAASGTPFAQAQFAAVGTGSELHVSALTTGTAPNTTSLAGVEQAFAGQSVNSTGLSNNHTPGKAGLFDSETGALIQPSVVTTAGKQAYGRGSGIEVGLATNNGATSNQNQLVFPSGTGGSKLVEASSVPSPSSDSNTLVNLTNTPLKPLVAAQALEASAATNFNNTFCPLGNPIAYGEGQLAGAQLLTAGEIPTVDTTNLGKGGVAQSKTYSYLSSNGDSTFGITSTTTQTILPLQIKLGPLTVQLTIQGSSPSAPVTLTAVAPGEAGKGGGVTLSGNHTVTIDILNGKTSVLGGAVSIDLQNILPKQIPIPGLGELDVSNLTKTGNGVTTAGGTFDLVHLKLNPGGAQLVDLALGHMAVLAAAQTPISCTIPVKKTADPDTVTAGQPFTYNISVPITANDLKDTTCDLVNINVVDTVSVDHADDPANPPTWTINSASNGGVISGNDKVTWTGLGPYHPGAPPIMLSINLTTTGTGGGVLKDIVNVTASLGNCKGNTQGLTGITTNLNGVGVTGGTTVIGPTIMGKKALPRTGGGGPILPWVAGGLLVLAEATRRIIKRARRAPSTT